VTVWRRISDAVGQLVNTTQRGQLTYPQKLDIAEGSRERLPRRFETGSPCFAVGCRI
jgi:hypothetical protein